MKHVLSKTGIAVLGGSLFLFLTALAWLAGEGGPHQGPGESPERIVSLAPSTTEILFSLGLGEKVVGVTEYCDYPEEAEKIPKIGGFKGKSMEKIVSLAPDLVIGTSDGNEARIFTELERLGLPVLKVQPATLTGAIESIREIGSTAGHPREAEKIARDMELRLMEVHSRIANAPKVKVLFVYGRDPLVLAGPGTFADDMIWRAGGENVASDALAPYPRFSMETVVARGPQVIVEGAMGSEGAGQRRTEMIDFWSRYDSIPAVRNRRLVAIDEDLIARPGPRLVDGLELLCRALHPELFEERM